jgi:hypothetical protein
VGRLIINTYNQRFIIALTVYLFTVRVQILLKLMKGGGGCSKGCISSETVRVEQAKGSTSPNVNLVKWVLPVVWL